MRVRFPGRGSVTAYLIRQILAWSCGKVATASKVFDLVTTLKAATGGL